VRRRVSPARLGGKGNEYWENVMEQGMAALFLPTAHHANAWTITPWFS
jgi:hypothetical protein